MTYQRRQECDAQIYHVIIRGLGRMLLFEDDVDRRKFVHYLIDARELTDVEIYAYCLMNNHVHLLFHGKLESVSKLMENLQRSYVRYFNKRYDRVGHLVQGRFVSVPIFTESQIVEVVRYIHRNPIEGGLAVDCNYPWSSYWEYVGPPDICATEWVLQVFDGVESFIEFHKERTERGILPSRSLSHSRMTDRDVIDLVNGRLADMGLSTLPLNDKKKRNAILLYLKQEGATIRQIERVTGIGRNIIAKVK